MKTPGRRTGRGLESGGTSPDYPPDRHCFHSARVSQPVENVELILRSGANRPVFAEKTCQGRMTYAVPRLTQRSVKPACGQRTSSDLQKLHNSGGTD